MGEGKKRKLEAKNGSQGGELPLVKGIETGTLTDDEIDPADFFDPEEFGYRRNLKILRR